MPDLLSVLFRARTALARRRELPPPLHCHDVSIQPGGHVIHHGTCWCRPRGEGER